MQHECQYQDLILKQQTKIAQIHTAIVGNGTKGLGERVTSLEDNVTLLNNFKAKVLVIGSIVGSVAGVLTSIAVKVLPDMFKG